MKRKTLLTILLLAIGTCSLHAQGFKPKGLALGVDRDTLLYIIASPFDNWYMSVSGSAQTFIGNEIEASARRNPITVGFNAEVGKWVIPDLAVSLKFGMFGVKGQSTYGLQPFINKTSDDTNSNGYYPFSATAAYLIGLVTMDWTNFFCGYESGKRRKTHYYSPIGLGMSVLYGEQRNPRGSNDVGKLARNYELAFQLGFGVEYELSQKVSVHGEAELFGSESTWDWSPYDNSYSIFDIVPMVSAGLKFNILHRVYRQNAYTGERELYDTYHEFRSVGSWHDMERRELLIKQLGKERDSLDGVIDNLRGENDDLRRALQDQYDSLTAREDSLAALREPANMLEDLANYNKDGVVPSTIIYYQLDRYDIDYNGRKRLQRMSHDVSRLPDTLEYYVIGAADSATGTIRHNQWLSEQRCNAAYRMMVDRYGVKKKQLIKVAVGGITDYEPKEFNRMAFIIQRTPETEKIVNRWLNKKQ